MFKKSINLKRFANIRLVLLTLIFILLGFSANLYLDFKYKTITSNFFTKFNNYKFSDAKNVLNNNLIKLKSQKFNEDLSSYFTKIIDKICTALKSGEITKEQAITILNEIKTYNVLGDSLDTLLLSLDENYQVENLPSTSSTNEAFNTAMNSFNNKDYSKAIENFQKISKDNSTDYENAKQYINICQQKYKKDLFSSADELIANKYYTKAIDLLSDYDKSILSEGDVDISKKINSVKMFRDEYVNNIQNEDTEYTSAAILKSITTNNVNSLNIDSKTSYFVYLNLDEQKTYVYEGSKNNWNLIKTFECSTGIAGEETPKGIFAVTNRGDWFFSSEFNQGGKYWVQFMGDYLFHSVPFDSTQSTVVDNTLGKPASHGCIRLKVDDSKWLYDNAENGTKIIIN